MNLLTPLHKHSIYIGSENHDKIYKIYCLQSNKKRIRKIMIKYDEPM